MGILLDIKITGVHQRSMHVITPIMKIFRFPDRRTTITVFTRTNAYSKCEIVRKASCLLVPYAADPGNVSGLYRDSVGVIFLRIACVSQVKAAPSLP